MLICNLKIKSNLILKVILALFFIVGFSIICLTVYELSKSSSFSVNDSISKEKIYNLSTSNYTDVLKVVHNNPDKYLGQKIKFSGYVYRVPDINSNQFILARNMVISSDYQTVVVGFLCEMTSDFRLNDGTWIEVIGTIEKGSYHGDIPIVKIESLNEITKPQDEFVYPPDEEYVETANVL